MMPIFNYTPSIPVTLRSRKEIYLSNDDNEKRRLEKQRIINHRYQEKAKYYTKLAAFPTDKSKFYGLALICYPLLKNANTHEIELIIDQFIDSLMSCIIAK